MVFLVYFLLVLTSDRAVAPCLGSISSICEFCKDSDNCRAPPRLNLMSAFFSSTAAAAAGNWTQFQESHKNRRVEIIPHIQWQGWEGHLTLGVTLWTALRCRALLWQ